MEEFKKWWKDTYMTEFQSASFECCEIRSAFLAGRASMKREAVEVALKTGCVDWRFQCAGRVAAAIGEIK